MGLRGIVDFVTPGLAGVSNEFERLVRLQRLIGSNSCRTYEDYLSNN